jgi:hypothetical protein
MRITPFAVLEQHARREYQRHFAPARVRNATAVVALGEHRPLRWRGHRYTVRPLPWRAGMVLLACVEVLRDQNASPRARESAVRNIARTAHSLVRARRTRRPWRNPFLLATPAVLLSLANWLIAVPDEIAVPPAEGARYVDLMDGLMEYLRAGYPATPEGLPVSWAHYQYALRHSGRTVARETLRLAQAVRVAQAGKDEWRKYTDALRNAAGGW